MTRRKAQASRRGNDAQANLPRKTCPACGRPFVWRKKWERDWAHVKYCSKACSRRGADRPA